MSTIDQMNTPRVGAQGVVEPIRESLRDNGSTTPHRPHWITNAPIAVSSADFLNGVMEFPLLMGDVPENAVAWVTHFPGDPKSAEAGNWRGRPWDGANVGTAESNSYVSVSMYASGPSGQVKRCKANFAGLLAVVLDDVGTKAHFPDLPPTFALETSPDNYQVWFVLDRAVCDLHTLANLETAVIAAGYTDPSASGWESRYVRLPGGINGKPWLNNFATVVRVYEPGRSYSVEQLTAGLGLVMAARESPACDKPAHAALENFPLALYRAPDSRYALEDARADLFELDASMGRNEWLRCLMAVHHQFSGTSEEAEALELVEEWSRGGDNWEEGAVEAAWQSLRPQVGTGNGAVTIALLRNMADKARESKLPAQLSRTPTRRVPLRVLSMADLAALPPPSWLLKGILPARGLAMLYGETSVGKTFCALDLVLSVARGIPWRGIKSKQAAAVYLAAEAQASIRTRIRAYEQHHGIELDNVPFGVIPQAINLMESSEADALIAACVEMDKLGYPLGLVVLDTLNRVMPGADENGSDSMGLVIHNAQALTRATGATVLIVHHSGKDRERGARGSSSLPAAMDTVLSIRKAGQFKTLTVEKQRDSEDGRVFTFDLKIVLLGVDEDRDNITSCVAVEAFPDEFAPAARDRKLGKWQALVLNAATRLSEQGAVLADGPVKFGLRSVLDGARDLLLGQGMSLPVRWEYLAQRGVEALLGRGMLLTADSLFWLGSPA